MTARKSARLESIEPIAEGTLLASFVLVDPPRMTSRPGQFVTLFLGQDARDKRSYSMSSFRPGGFDIVVKLIPQGVGSAWFAAAEPGDTVDYMGPLGFFVPDETHPGDVLFAATGSGLTPVVPMLEAILPRSENSRVRLLHGVHRPAELFFTSRLQELADAHERFSFTPYVTRPDASWTGKTGRISSDAVDIATSMREPTCYLVGNGAMVKQVKADLVAAGLDRKRQIRSEIFHNPPKEHQ